MKNVAYLFLLIPVLAFSQPAPDFTVTDSDGIQHSLYGGYLNQDRTVLIKVFFTTCPPCRSIASSMEIYYQEWGAGMGDVEFIELSNKTFDDDTRVNNYKAEFGITFPSVGADGGSLEALVPYQNGTYGPFTGTPLFVVIGPDGEVDFDVDGPDLWEALDEALYATGAMKPGDDPPDTTEVPDPDPVVIEGRVYAYHNTLLGLTNAEVIITDLQGAELFRDTTEANGSYSFSIDSAFFADNDMLIHVERYDDPTNGVTASDLVAIQKHLLGLAPFPRTEQLIASDANKSFSVSALDLLFLKRLLLELEDHFIDGQSWDFLHADVNLSPPGDQPPVVEIPSMVSLQEIHDGTKSADFVGIKRGDVNNTAN